MTTERANEIMSRLLGQVGPWLLAAVLGMVLYIMQPVIAASASIDSVIQRQDSMERLYEQRFLAAQAQERYYNERFNELTRVETRVDGLEKRMDRAEDRVPPRTGKP